MTEQSPLTLESRVRISEDVLFQDLQGEAVLLNLNSGVYYGLDPVGTRVWQLLGTHEKLADIASAVLDEFEVEKQTCEADLLALMGELEKRGLVTACSDVA